MRYALNALWAKRYSLPIPSTLSRPECSTTTLCGLNIPEVRSMILND